MERTIIRTPVGQPVSFELNGKAPKPSQGRDGQQWQYIVNKDTAIMWLPPEAHQAIQQSGAQNGDVVTITKPQGTGVWAVRTNRQQQQYTPVQMQPAQAAAVQQQQQPAEQARPGSEMVAGYLYCAIDAVVAAEKYAKDRHGWTLQFNAEQVRLLAVTLMINTQKENR